MTRSNFNAAGVDLVLFLSLESKVLRGSDSSEKYIEAYPVV